MALVTSSSCLKKVKHSIQNFGDFTEHFDSAISPEKRSYIIEIEEDVPIICKGMLNITIDTPHLYADNKNIREIEVGAFDDQRLTSQLRISNSSLSIIKRGTFRNMLITHLELAYNKITVIEEGAFQNMPNLMTLYLSSNKIMEFHPTSLVNTPKLLFFDMTHNELGKLKERHFYSMSKDRNVGIGMGSNRLKEIHPRTFEGIDVFTLNLSNNMLESIPKEVFSGNKLHYLDIANNKLTHLDNDFFAMNTEVLRNVELDGNNFEEETVKKLEPFMKIIMENRRQDSMYHF
ncbi:hypothetical protein NQ318_014945 [Aromia moschata]|uniref:Uncharacterized protein n=1 Tax=Aromia moschata TaxID=1265417 RepID=A0AAV8XL76_9CUCU|nr:hypothetical protein NQ318_014945 [Aromia moschata]